MLNLPCFLGRRNVCSSEGPNTNVLSAAAVYKTSETPNREL